MTINSEQLPLKHNDVYLDIIVEPVVSCIIATFNSKLTSYCVNIITIFLTDYAARNDGWMLQLSCTVDQGEMK